MIYSDLVGIPFAENGDSLEKINCFNLMRKALTITGKFVPPTNVAVCANKCAANAEIYNQIVKDWTQIEEPEIGCGILINSINASFANHIGTYVGSNRILHITMNTNSLIERLYPKFKNKILGFFQYTGGSIE